MSAMIGTDQPKPSCICLKGVVGKSASCGIYEHRPNCCRIFKASFENGEQNVSCEEARASKGIRALTMLDWEEHPEPEIKKPSLVGLGFLSNE